MCDRLRILQELATTIHGVSDATIFKTIIDWNKKYSQLFPMRIVA